MWYDDFITNLHTIMTFELLKFQKKNYSNWTQAKLFFDNWYWVSVIQWYGSYTNSDDEYELAVLRWNEERFTLCYDTEITDDVLGYLSKEEVSSIINQVKSL